MPLGLARGPRRVLRMESGIDADNRALSWVGMPPRVMSGVVRTPEDTLQELRGFPFASSYREVDGLRHAHLDEGEGPPVIFFHGEPPWSFLWRNVIPPVRDAGFRCIAPDLVGLGCSDKPSDIDFYSYVESLATIGHTATCSLCL